MTVESFFFIIARSDDAIFFLWYIHDHDIISRVIVVFDENLQCSFLKRFAIVCLQDLSSKKSENN